MTESNRKRPRVTAPMPSLMTSAEIDKALKRASQHLKLPFGIKAQGYDPADGVHSHERRKLYIKERAKEHLLELQYHLHGLSMRSTKLEVDTTPINGHCDSDQVWNFREKYARCRSHGFCTDPWDRAHIDELFEDLSNWTIGGVKASDGVRNGWTFEKGLDKIYRADSRWSGMSFDEDDLAPEETAAGVSAQAWLDEYTKRRLEKQHSPMRRRFQSSHPPAEIAVPKPPPPARSTTRHTNASPFIPRKISKGVETHGLTLRLNSLSISSESSDEYSACKTASPRRIGLHESASDDSIARATHSTRCIMNDENDTLLVVRDSKRSVRTSSAQTLALGRNGQADVVNVASSKRIDSALDIQ